MVILLKMTVGKVLWMLALFAATTFAYNLTCTDLSWESNVKRATSTRALTLRNTGNHILVLSSMRLDCFGDDKRFEYTNKSVLLNPGQNMDLPNDPWMHNCSATFCSACLIYQCNIITQLNPDATLTFLYNASGLVDFSGVGYAHQSHVRTRKSNRAVESTTVCPKDMVSVWTKNELPTALIDIPNKKKKKTIYTVMLTCNGSYLSDEHGNATKSFSHTTSVKKLRADVIVTVPLQKLGETPRTCTLNACLHRKRFCRQKVLCIFTIPDNSTALKKLNKWKKTRYRTVGCSQTKWVWSVTDQQTGDLHIRLRNKDWKEKSFIVSVRCKRLTALNDSVLVTVPPMIYTKLVTFPLKILAMKSTATSTKCVIKLCNTAKRKCGRNTKCSITLPVNNGKFITTLFNITDNNINGQCGSKAVTWSPQGKRRGTLTVKLQNAEQETVTATASVNCSGLEVLQEQWNLTVELPPNSQEYAVEFKLKPTSIDSAAVETYCTVNTCNAKNCRYLGESCNTTIPVKDGAFIETEIKDGNALNTNNETDNNITDNCESKSVSWTPQGTRRGLLSVQLLNSREITVISQVLVNCTELEVLKDEWNRTSEISPNSLHTATFKLKPKASIDVTALETYCTVRTCSRKDCGNQGQFCSSDITIPIEDGLLLEINDTGKFESRSISWSKQGIRRGTVSIQLQNAKQKAVIAEVSVNCSGLEVVDGKWIKTVKVPATSLDVTEFLLRPNPTLDDDAVETYCTVEICNIEDCENQTESYVVTIPVEDGLFPDDTGIFTNEAVWAQQGTKRGTLSVKLRNTKQKGVTAEVTVNCSGLEIVNQEWNKTVRVPSDTENTVEFRLRPSATLDYAAVETNCTIVISCPKNRGVSHVTIPVKNGFFPDENSTNNTDRFQVDSVVWSQQGPKRGIVSVQLDNSKHVAVIAEVTVNCAGLEVLKDQWNLTVEVRKNSQRAVEFKIKPSVTIDITAVKTYCIVNICNKEDCENQGESHNITVPIKKGLFSNNKKGDTPISCDSNSVTWEIQGKQRVIVSVQLQNSRQGTISIQVSVVCSEIEVVKNVWNVTADVPADSLYTEKFKLKPKDSIDVTAVKARCTLKTCNTEDCCSYDITIPVKNGLFPENDEDENRIAKRETTALCPSDIVYSNQSSSDFPTVFVIVRNIKRNALPFIIEIICNNIFVFRDNGTLSGSVIKRIPSIQPKAQKVVEFRFQNNSNREKACALDICVERKSRCSSEMSCGFTFLKNTTLPSDLNNGISVSSNMPSMTTISTTDTSTMTPVPTSTMTSVPTTDTSTMTPVPTTDTSTMTPVPTTDTSTMTPVPTTDTSTMTPVPTEEQHTNHKECTQKDAVWEVNQPLRGVMKVKAYNLEQEEIEATVTLQCSSFLQPVNDRITDSITIPGRSFRPVKFRFLPKTDTMIDAEEPDEAQCVINICPQHDCTVGVKETCIIRMPMKDGGFVIVKPAKKKDNETKYIAHKCHDEHGIHSPAPCHDKMWNLVYTSAQLEGEALLIIRLNIKPNNQVDLRTNVSLKCEGIIIEDDAQKILMISKYETQRNISFAFATIRSLHLEKHTCTVSVQHSLLIASTNNITDDAIEKLCLNGEKCSVAIDSRLGRIIPKCNLSQVKSLINYTSIDQNSAKVTISILPSVYDVFTYEAHCSKNNPFAYDPVHDKKMNAFVSESKETKVITVEYAPDCNNDTIRKEYENYRKDDCNFLLYGYCQGGELLLEKLVNIQFDHDKMYCIPKLLFNKWLQTIQKHTGIHSKPLAAVLAVFVVIAVLLIAIIIPIIIVVYCCCCRRHRDNAKRPSVGIVISSCDEWEETNAMLNAMSVENSKFLTGRYDQQIPDKKFSVTDDFDDSFDSLSSDFEDVGSPIYQRDSGKGGQDDNIDQEDSAIYHDPEDHHHHHKHIDQHEACACDSTAIYTAQLELEAAIKQLDVINESIPEERYSNLSVTRTDLSSSLHGWGDEDGDTGELLKSTNY